MRDWWRRLQWSWDLQRRPFSIAILGVHSRHISPPLDFLRFRTALEADHWIVQRELCGELDERTRLTQWIVVDLRLPEQDPVIG